MPDEEKKPRHPEINFLPPLDMILSFFKKKDQKKNLKDKPADEKESEEKAVEKIIDKLNKEK
jgi:hypothetical protein